LHSSIRYAGQVGSHHCTRVGPGDFHHDRGDQAPEEPGRSRRPLVDSPRGFCALLVDAYGCRQGLRHIRFRDFRVAQQDVHQHLLESAKAAGVELLVLVYHGCHRVLCDAQGRYPFAVKNFTSLLVEALGLEPHEDLFQRYKLHQDVKKIMDDAEPFMRAHGMDPKAVEAAFTDPALWV